jgi:hypothetical protein
VCNPPALAPPQACILAAIALNAWAAVHLGAAYNRVRPNSCTHPAVPLLHSTCARCCIPSASPGQAPGPMPTCGRAPDPIASPCLFPRW